MDTTEARSVFLRLPYLMNQTSAELPPLPPKEEQYYFPEGLPAEMTVLLTTFTRAHFVLMRSLKLADLYLIRNYRASRDVARSPVDGHTIALGDIEPHFRRLTGLRRHEEQFGSRRIEPFMLACRLYHLALELRQTDGSLAYITLVSAIEALLHDVKITLPSLEKVDARLASVVREHSPQGYPILEKEILRRESFIKKRFVSFALGHLGDSYWNDPSRPREEWARFRDREHLATYLSRIYDARSETLHDGVPFPPSFSILNHREEVPLGGGMRMGKKGWKATDLLPPFRAFERIVHHVLIEYLHREAEKASEDE